MWLRLWRLEVCFRQAYAILQMEGSLAFDLKSLSHCMLASSFFAIISLSSQMSESDH